MDILWPRWVARIGVTRATEACFLTADRQCTELPLLRLPRLVPEVVGCDPFVPRDLARVGWRGLAPFLPIGPHKRPRLADSFLAPGSGARGIPRVARPAIRRVAAMRGKERGPRGTPPSGPLRGGKGIAGSPRAPQFGPPEGGRGARGPLVRFLLTTKATTKALSEKKRSSEVLEEERSAACVGDSQRASNERQHAQRLAHASQSSS